MSINLYSFLDCVGFVECEVFLRDEKGRDNPLFIGYPVVLQEHLELCNRTGCYSVFYIQSVKNNVLQLLVVEV